MNCLEEAVDVGDLPLEDDILKKSSRLPVAAYQLI
jgi:hypothetical protein